MLSVRVMLAGKAPCQDVLHSGGALITLPHAAVPAPGARPLRGTFTACLATACLATALSAAALLLAGCAAHGERAAGGLADKERVDVESAPAAVAPTETPPPPAVERPIPQTSVYPLLLAEFALRRRDFNTALETYLEQAEALREPAVSAYTTHLAQYMRREREAFRAVRLWAEIEPASVEANHTLATLLAHQGRTREALPHLAIVARSGEAAKFPVLLNGYKTLSPPQQAALDSAVQALLDEDLGDNVSLLLTHALMAHEAQQPEVAMARLAPVFARQPYQQQALILQAQLRRARGEPDPLARIEEALEADASRSGLRLQYARLLAEDDMAAARVQFEMLSEQAPQDTDLLFSLAVISHELQDRAAAKAYLHQVIALNQRQNEAHFLLGQIEMGAGDREQAIAYFKQVGDGEDLIRATLNIARLQLNAGNERELARYMDELRESYPPRREQLYALEANLYSESRRDGRSLAVLARAIGEYPRSDTLRYARSILYERAGDIAAAETDLRSILERNPDNATALNALGYTLANRTERLDEARVLIEKALRLSPGEPAILDSMGWVLYHQGDYAEAIRYLARAYAQFPDPEVAAHLGEALWVSGNRTRAMQVWRGALRKDSQHLVLNETLDRLGISLQADADTTAP